MAQDPGYTLSQDNYKRVASVVKRIEHLPINAVMPRPRKGPKFPPGAGAKFWQAVAALRLRRIDPEVSSSTYEPCILAVPAGTVEGTPSPLSNRDTYYVQKRISTSGLFDNDGLLRRSRLSELNTDSAFTDQAGGEVVAIAARYADFIGTGDIFTGSDQQVTPGSGHKLLTVTIDEVLTSSTILDLILNQADGRFYLAHVTGNQPAIDGGIAFTGFEIDDYLIVHDSPDSDVKAEGDTVQVFKERTIWLSDDISYSPSAWVKHSERGWLPVMEAIRTIPIVLGKATDGGFAGNAATFTVQTTDSSHGKGSEIDSETTVFAYVRRGFVFRDRKYRLGPCCPGTNIGSTVTLEVLDPELRAKATTAAAITSGDVGDVQLKRRVDGTTYSAPNMDLVLALNDLDFDIASGADVEIVEETDDSGNSQWRIVYSDYTCP